MSRRLLGIYNASGVVERDRQEEDDDHEEG